MTPQKQNPAGGRGDEIAWDGGLRCQELNTDTPRDHVLTRLFDDVLGDATMIVNERAQVSIRRLPALASDDDQRPFVVKPLAIIEPWISGTGAARIVIFVGWAADTPIAIEAPMSWLASRGAWINALREAGVFLHEYTVTYQAVLDALPSLPRLGTGAQARAFWHRLETLGEVE